MSGEIYEHFHPDERPFVDRAWEWVVRAGERHETRLTDFLDPRQAYIVSSLANRSANVGLRLDGGYPQAERKRAIIAPDYRFLEDEPMDIGVLSITSIDSKLESLDHGDYMGAILGLGIKRDKIGDIHVLENGCHCLASKDILPFLDTELRQVHRVHVLTEILPPHMLQTSSQQLDEMNVTVASLRLDGIASDVFRLSRAKILTPIKAGKCRVNWKVEDNPAKPLRSGDIVSMQGFGRFKVIEIGDATKSGRIRIKLGKFV